MEFWSQDRGKGRAAILMYPKWDTVQRGFGGASSILPPEILENRESKMT